MSLMSCVVDNRVTSSASRSAIRNCRNPFLADHVEADGRLIENEQPRSVDQSRRDLTPHPFPERELPYGHLDLAGQPAPVGRGIHTTGADRAAAGHQDAGQHLDGGGFAQTISASNQIQTANSGASHPSQAGSMAGPGRPKIKSDGKLEVTVAGMTKLACPSSREARTIAGL
jgi:hypothetical protein